MTIFTDLISNVALLLALSILHSFLTRIWKRGEMTGRIFAGFLFGGVAVVGMMIPFHYAPGIIFDGRSMVVSMAGLFGGPVTAAISALIAGVYRLGLGGAGALTGLGVVFTSAALGAGYHYLRRKNPDVIKPLYLLAFGVIVHISMLLWMLTLPWPVAFEVLQKISIPVMLIFPLGTLFLGTLLADQEEHIYAQKALREGERRLADIINFLPDATLAVNSEKKIIVWNKAIEKMTGIKAEDMLGKGNYEYTIPFYGERRPQLMDLIWKTEQSIFEKYPLVNREGDSLIAETFCGALYDGRGAHVFAKVSPLHDREGNVVGAIESIRDITDRKHAEEEIIRSLREKESLLAEIHHRVKNNMQIISSLLSLQSKDIEDERALSLIKNCEDRIRSMSLVHENLYLSKDLSEIDFSDYMKDLSVRLFQVHRVDSRVVTFSSHIKDVSFSIETAIPLGLIANELISNALKHGFPEGGNGNIAVELTQDTKTEEYTLTVTDDGIGFPEAIDYQNPETFGLQLVDMLTEQLSSTMEIDRSKGTSFKIIFKKKEYKKRI